MKNKIIIGISTFILAIGILSSVGTIPAGHRGVHTRFQAVTGKVFGEGLYFKVPFIDNVKKLNVRIQKIEAQASAASKDLQTVDANIALNFHIDPTMAVYVYQNIGTYYQYDLITPAIQESIKSGTAKFTAEELITKRQDVRDQIKTNLSDKLNKHGFIIDELNIENFSFSESFDKAVEEKVTAEQQALAAQNKLEQVKFEAQQKIEEAKGKAEALRVEAEAISTGRSILELEAIKKWNGQLPTYMGGDTGALPFINLN
jgi:regulator of protease activity HflC (stomatin/prohibitin superfamily)